MYRNVAAGAKLVTNKYGLNTQISKILSNILFPFSVTFIQPKTVLSPVVNVRAEYTT
jgi:hypothetical protein